MKLRLPLLLALSLFALPLSGGDDPHGQLKNVQCFSCHAGHKAAGANLTNQASNELVCSSCHNLGGDAAAKPLESFNKADLTAKTGSSHSWAVPAIKSNAGAGTPSWTQMSVRLDGGNIICSTCHNQHGSNAEAVASGQAGTQNASTPVKTAGAGGGSVSYTNTATASAKSYLIEIVETAGGTGTAKFRLSNDGGISWFGWSGAAWVAYDGGNARATAANVTLNDGANVTAQFSGTFALGDTWQFYVTYPFLRLRKTDGIALDEGAAATGDKFCRVCHADWAMTHTDTRTYDGSFKSHPTGVGLNANGESYDRGSPLDGNGGSDANSTNDLVLAADGTVQCLTCHGVHYADGNTTTVDQP